MVAPALGLVHTNSQTDAVKEKKYETCQGRIKDEDVREDLKWSLRAAREEQYEMEKT